MDDRTALREIVYVLRKGRELADVPTERIDRSSVTAWRQLHQVLPAELRRAGLPDMDDAVIDGSHVRALKGGSHRIFAGRSRASGQQVPPDHRPERDTSCGVFDRRKTS